MSGHVNLPPVVIHSGDKNALVLCATLASRLGRPGAEFLMRELRRASLCAAESLPANVVSLGSRVTYRVDGLPSKTSVLVLPSEVHRGLPGLSVLTPLGTALLGLRVGARMVFQTPEGIESAVIVVRVERPGTKVRTRKRRSTGGWTRLSIKRSRPVTLCRLSAPHARQIFSMQSSSDEHHEAARAEARHHCQ